jgi:hypothetical protein
MHFFKAFKDNGKVPQLNDEDGIVLTLFSFPKILEGKVSL